MTDLYDELKDMMGAEKLIGDRDCEVVAVSIRRDVSVGGERDGETRIVITIEATEV